MDATACSWCSAPIPPAAAGAYVVRGGEYELPACSVGCLAALAALVAGVRLDGAEARAGRV